MPTYEYVCTKCGERLEVFLRFAEEQPSQCPVCGGVLRKVFHPAGILFKGSGFYKTDNRASSKRSEAKPDSKGSEAASTGSKGGSASKGSKESKGSSDSSSSDSRSSKDSKGSKDSKTTSTTKESGS